VTGKEKYGIGDYGPPVARHNHIEQTEEGFDGDIAE